MKKTIIILGTVGTLAAVACGFCDPGCCGAAGCEIVGCC